MAATVDICLKTSYVLRSKYLSILIGINKQDLHLLAENLSKGKEKTAMITSLYL